MIIKEKRQRQYGGTAVKLHAFLTPRNEPLCRLEIVLRWLIGCDIMCDFKDFLQG
jgi:hypothetical protein